MKTILAAIFLLSLSVSIAQAQSCTLPYTLANGQASDASQVMANYNALLNCISAVGSVNTGAVGQVGYYASSGNTISGESLSGLIDQTFGSAQGSILYRGASGWVILPPGTTGQFLQTQGNGANPQWATGGGGGGGIGTIIGGGVASSAAIVALPTIPVISRPALSSLTWVNQQQATATDNANGPLVLRTTQNTGGNGINALIKSVAGSSWTLTIEYGLGNHIAGTNLDISGLVVQNSSTGHMYICGIAGASTINVWAYSSPTAWNSNSGSKNINVNYGTIWTRAQYDSTSTTLTFSYSIDGLTWETIYSTGSPYVGVPTGYGIAVGTQGNGSGYVLSLNYMADTSP